ncbi:D-alanyl-D-alanine carboxypeptidase [Thermocatellispora tengchongensis]|uniref:D-alanyl-D-alanine carboxypeptidase n=1 Tax=Thermocatellispora tengchongensis TaxID=1073253 RepID=A0A840PLR8_9ACTN|nr:Clp protease N-terminal domain-containing protein [Thermocatellispora tengchongensis]MBB5138580.1 D-alanyl-D-alanine carboxypeptidase [Thermocatellispora tengchongensis]
MAAIDEYINAITERAVEEARQEGAAAVEAQHLLLAVAAGQDPATRRVLASAGLDEQAIRAALEREFEHSLSAAGVSLSGFRLPRPSPALDRPKLGASAKLALERGFASVSRKRDLRPAHLLLGVLLAEAGTVPRALALAGVEAAELAAAVRRELPA